LLRQNSSGISGGTDSDSDIDGSDHPLLGDPVDTIPEDEDEDIERDAGGTWREGAWASEVREWWEWVSGRRRREEDPDRTR
jgi:hypothetical protein